MKKYIISIIALFLLFTVLYLTKQPQEETIVVLKEQDTYPDLKQSDQGSIVIDFKAVEENMNIGGKFPTKVLLFRSNKITGLIIYYLYEDKKIQGGLPKLTTPQVNLLDGNLHQIAYTFKKDDKQALYVDGKKKAESNYDPLFSSKITGFAVKEPEDEIKVKGNINFNLYDTALTEKEIKSTI